MSATIDSPDMQIRSCSGRAAANTDRLADALKKPWDNAKLTTVTKDLPPAGGALDELQNSSDRLNGIKGLAGALKSMPGIQKFSSSNSTLSNCNCSNSNRKASFTVHIHHRVFVAVGKHIITNFTLPIRNILIRINEPANKGVVVSAL